MAMYAEEPASSLSEEAGLEAVDICVGGLDAWDHESDGAAGMGRGDGDDYDDLLLVDGRLRVSCLDYCLDLKPNLDHKP